MNNSKYKAGDTVKIKRGPAAQIGETGKLVSVFGTTLIVETLSSVYCLHETDVEKVEKENG